MKSLKYFIIIGTFILSAFSAQAQSERNEEFAARYLRQGSIPYTQANGYFTILRHFAKEEDAINYIGEVTRQNPDIALDRFGPDTKYPDWRVMIATYVSLTDALNTLCLFEGRKISAGRPPDEDAHIWAYRRVNSRAYANPHLYTHKYCDHKTNYYEEEVKKGIAEPPSN